MEDLSEILKQTTESKAVVYYGDRVHPTHNTRSTHAWIEKGTGREKPTVSGRDRVNISTVLNAKDIALDCESVNAASTRELYEKVLEKNLMLTPYTLLQITPATIGIRSLWNG